MPRVNGVYSLLSGTLGTPNTTIQSAPYNAAMQDLALDANAVRPVIAGGTGATTMAGARTNLDVYSKAELNGAAEKAAPVDADGVLITDSAASGVAKRVLWSRIKATLKAYFDPIYQTALGYVPVNKAGDTMSGRLNAPALGVSTLNYWTINGSGDPVIYWNSTAGDYTFYDSSTRTVYTRSGGTNLIISSTGAKFDNSVFITDGGALRICQNASPVLTLESATNVEYGALYGVSDGTVFLRYGKGDYRLQLGGGSGNLFAPAAVYAGGTAGAILSINGNVSGTIWDLWGAPTAFAAIGLRIEARADAFATLRANAVQANLNAVQANIPATIAGMGVGTLGTYAMLRNATTTALSEGDVVAGSNLLYSNTQGGLVGGSPPGSWRAMGRAHSTSQGINERVCLFLRYA